MAEIHRWVLVDKRDKEGTEEHESLHDAMIVANLNDHGDFAIILRTYVLDDSELVWTPSGGDAWPPGEES